MRDAEKTETENATLGFLAAVYYTVMLVAFVIGLYGFFSLFWLATSAVGRDAQILSMLF
jgi:nitrate reductase NapE component